MTDTIGAREWNLDPIGTSPSPPEQARGAALTVAATFMADPLIVRYLLDALGLFDLRHPSQEVTSTTAPGSADAAETRPPVNTGSATETLGMAAPTLFRFAEARIVTPARVDPDGARWWNLCEMRQQIATYLDDHGEAKG